MTAEARCLVITESLFIAEAFLSYSEKMFRVKKTYRGPAAMNDPTLKYLEFGQSANSTSGRNGRPGKTNIALTCRRPPQPVSHDAPAAPRAAVTAHPGQTSAPGAERTTTAAPPPSASHRERRLAECLSPPREPPSGSMTASPSERRSAAEHRNAVRPIRPAAEYLHHAVRIVVPEPNAPETSRHPHDLVHRRRTVGRPVAG